MDLKDIKIGAPLVFKSGIYGDTAVHVTSIYQDVIHFTIDGGEASRQVRDFPELSDGTYFAIASRLEKRLSKARKTAALKKAFETMPETIKNTIREVPGVGKVALVETGPIDTGNYIPTPPALQMHIEKAATEQHPMAPLDRMSIAQLRAHAAEIGMSTGTKLTRKADLKRAIVAFVASQKVETF